MCQPVEKIEENCRSFSVAKLSSSWMINWGISTKRVRGQRFDPPCLQIKDDAKSSIAKEPPSQPPRCFFPKKRKLYEDSVGSIRSRRSFWWSPSPTHSHLKKKLSKSSFQFLFQEINIKTWPNMLANTLSHASGNLSTQPVHSVLNVLPYVFVALCCQICVFIFSFVTLCLARILRYNGRQPGSHEWDYWREYLAP